jgi:Ca2+/Na+ antiporter
MNDKDLVKTGQNAYRETMKDGLIEILTGLFFILSPILFIEPPFIPFFVVFYVFLLPYLVEIFRKKYTCPRVGYVKLRTDPLDYRPKALLALLFFVIVSSAILVMLMTQDVANYYNWFTMFPFILGTALLAPSAYLVDRTGAKIYWGFGIVTTILGLVISTISLTYPTNGLFDGLLAFSMLLGIGLLLGGLIKFAYFLHTNPVIDIQEDTPSE